MSRTLEQLVKDLDEISKRKFRQLISRESKRFALKLESKAKQNATTLLGVRTGRLRNSIKASQKESQDNVLVTLTAGDVNVKYARIQELGGTIRPRKGRFLAIPLPAAKTGAGDLKAEYAGGWRGKPGVFVLRTHGGTVFLAKKEETGLALLAQLVTQTTIKRKWYLHRALASEAPLFKQRLNEGIRKLLGHGQDTP